MNNLTKDKLIRTTGGDRTVHVFCCDYIKDWRISGLENIDKFKPNKMKTCPDCRNLIYIFHGAKDFDKHWKIYKDMFKNIHYSRLSNLFINKKAKIEYSNNNFYITTKTDNWKIQLDILGNATLYHGNYNSVTRSENKDNYQKEGYHEHKNAGNTINACIGHILRYNPKKADKIHKKRRNKEPTMADIF